MSGTDTLSQLQKLLRPSLDAVKEHCSAQRETIAVAESVTAGCLQLALSTTQQAQDFFQGGITAYNCAQKAIHLAIDPIFAESCNAVDMNIAIKMADKVCKLFRSQVGVGITGYATKAPEEGINDLYAYVAIVRNGNTIYEGKIEPASEGIEAQWDYAAQVVHILAKELTGKK